MDDLQKAFSMLGKRNVQTFAAEVTEVDKENSTCTVRDEEIDYYNVQLSAIIDGSKKQLFIYPVVGSSVLVSPIEEDIKQLYIEVYSEVEVVDWNIESVKFNFSKDGFLLKKDNETLAKLMSDLLKEIQNMKFTTNTGSTTALVNLPQFLAIETRFKNFLKDN